MTDPKRVLENRASSSYIAEYSAPKIELADLGKLQQVRHLNLNKKTIRQNKKSNKGTKKHKKIIKHKKTRSNN